MPTETDPILYLMNEKSELRGVLISPELWEKIEPLVRKHLPQDKPAHMELLERPEPMADWETLVQFWDFKYPVSYEVSCDQCGSHTDNWKEDDPRKFQLYTATLGGLVTFVCRNCYSRVLKKHFKDRMTFETQPYHDAKDPKLNAVYGEGRREAR